MKLLRHSAEAEVIAEFLKAEFYQEEFNSDRKKFEGLVLNPDLADTQENHLRKMLLFRRRATMWRELPDDTQWFQVELDRADLERMRVFPRAHWRKLAGGDLRLREIVHSLRHGKHNEAWNNVISKIHGMRYRFQLEESVSSSVLLIGTDAKSPFTILEGNHRIAAGMLVSPAVVLKRFRVYVGLSKGMQKCCWYDTNFTNLCQYAVNRIRHLFDDTEGELKRAFASAPATAQAPGIQATTAGNSPAGGISMMSTQNLNK